MIYSQQLQVIIDDAQKVIHSFLAKSSNRTSFIIEDVSRPGKEVLTTDTKELFWLADNPSIVELADTLQATRGHSNTHFVDRYRRFMLGIVTDVIRRPDLQGPFERSDEQLVDTDLIRFAELLRRGDGS